ncbi:FAD binding domain-containing protein [Ferruginibacter yonginensis]|uniref:FAD binding domain-containing protein n=1 Tax=Ferruginibacter yonginensis TaxID=1310416 RepID=A0ABV8QPJ0_9BACT
MKPFVFSKPTNVRQALTKKTAATQYIAGGTNLVDLMKKAIATPDVVIDVTQSLSNQIERTTKGIRIGAMVRNSALHQHPIVVAQFPLVAKAVLAGASPQIRNMASTGGNLLQRTRCPYFYDIVSPCNKRTPGSGCSALTGDQRMAAIVGYSDQCVAVHPSDLCVALAALDANVIITDKSNNQRTIAFNNFHRLPGNNPAADNNLPEGAIINAIEIPDNPFNKHYSYVKVRDRDSYAFALISVAAGLQLNGNTIVAATLASGGVAHQPWRWNKAAAFLKGKAATAANFTAAATIAVSETKALANNGFKTLMLQGAIETALQNCLTV